LNVRPFVRADRLSVYKLFREVIWDFMLAQGVVAAEDKFDLDEYFDRQQNYYIHLETHASEDWVAEDNQNNIVGWARSIERDDHLQLTHFFVNTKTQGSGVGRALLDRAFPVGRGRQRSIIATTNPRALALYLRYGVSFQGMAFTLYGRPQSRALDTNLDIELAESSIQTLNAVLNTDSAILGYRRTAEIEFFMNNQPTFLFRRRGELVAYAFGYKKQTNGPAAALSNSDMPALLRQIEQSAVAEGVDSLELVIPAMVDNAVRWALESGYQMDPFHKLLLTSNPDMKLDRYLINQSSFTW
jgi:ribosomal protein S18 acetylase RimI-like enzyme